MGYYEFFTRALKPGVHYVEVDPDNLCDDLVAKVSSLPCWMCVWSVLHGTAGWQACSRLIANLLAVGNLAQLVLCPSLSIVLQGHVSIDMRVAGEIHEPGLECQPQRDCRPHRWQAGPGTGADKPA